MLVLSLSASLSLLRLQVIPLEIMLFTSTFSAPEKARGDFGLEAGQASRLAQLVATDIGYKGDYETTVKQLESSISARSLTSFPTPKPSLKQGEAV